MPPSPPPSPSINISAAVHAMDRLVDRMDELATPACVGLDPVIEKLPPSLTESYDAVSSIERFSIGVVEAVGGQVPVLKVQSACFERYGSAGWAAMERVVVCARDAGLWVLLDAKRGDIATSASHYAHAAVSLGVDAITVNPYLGPSSIEPFLEAGLAVFALCRTSNPDSDVLQAAVLDDGSTVAEHVGSMLDEIGSRWMGNRGLSALGAVVGATQTQSAQSLRQRMPNTMFLMPGIGAQGASVSDVATLRRSVETGSRSGLMPTASRSVLYPKTGTSDWIAAISQAARTFAAQAASAAGS